MASQPSNSQAARHSLGPSLELTRTYRFEAAHFLPQVSDSHPCRRVHGHGYRVTITVEGRLDSQAGWVMDFAAIDTAVRPAIDALDHRLLNDLEGLENPTSENLAVWLWRKLVVSLPALIRFTVAETEDSRCTFRGIAGTD
jgi:6-pyruvoyltetrahydropterin/6-carboxytetrahydropterin synthase